MIRSAFLTLGALLLILHASIAQNNEVVHRIFLVGDAGEPYVTDDPLGVVLRDQIEQSGENTTVLYLGDNVYPKGLVPEGHRLREQSEKILMNQYSWIQKLPARGYFVPGNHDWHHWGRNGLEYVQNAQRWLDSLRDDRVTQMPRDGCPGPEAIELGPNTVLVLIDTQWFLHQWDKPEEEGPCEFKTPQDVLAQIDDILSKNRNKRVIIAGHHPLITYGEHGGVFTFKAHLFPLQELSDHLYVPMPIVGSIYPLYRKYFGHLQDVQHPLYKQFADALSGMMKQYPGTVYVAGHEHALQYIRRSKTHFVVSGSGAKVEYVKKKGDALFASAVRGFAVLESYADKKLVLRFIQVDNKFPKGQEIYRQELEGGDLPTESVSTAMPDLTGQVVAAVASRQYGASKAKKFFLGSNYRKEWSTPVNVPLFDIGTIRGGLKILQRGGGQQTLSLRIEDSAGFEYVIRSVEKFPEHAVPEFLRKTFAQDLVQDQISASHPYAALAIAPLAEAAGIYHTNPALYLVPDDPRLGAYRKLFRNQLVIFEERPAGDWSHADNFGNSKKIVNTTKVLEKIIDDNDNTVDEAFVLRSRLFDMVIGDWDRHDDQWRWASFKKKKNETYRPIPRDRDQAFFVNEGKLARVWSRRWALPKFEGFDNDIDWAPGLSFNARYFDRTFLTSLTKDQWLATAVELQRRLTDDAIERAIRSWPKQIFEISGETIITALKKRRDQLPLAAEELYEFLSKEVEVRGSDKKEMFEATFDDSGLTISSFKLSKKGERGDSLYHRKFSYKETNEVRLFGLGGDDRFKITGNGGRKMKLRIIGGQGFDTLRNQSAKAVSFYDQFGQGAFQGAHVRDRREKTDDANAYDRKAFRYDRVAPLLFGNFNPDDGLFFGGGFVAVTHGFRKDPFKQRHLFLASVAPRTGSYNFQYDGTFTGVIGKWDAGLDLDVKSPNYVNNFFGFGNESKFDRKIDENPAFDLDESIDYYRYRFEELQFTLLFKRKFLDGGLFTIGPSLQRIEMEEPNANQSRFISSYAAGLNYDLFDEYHSFAGVKWRLGFEKRDNPILTSRGVSLSIGARNMAGLDAHTNSFSSYDGAIAFYHRFRMHQRVTFAWRVGGGLNTGKYEFYQAQILDGRTQLRGYRKTRFYGDSKIYSNAEIRLRLAQFRSYLFPASFGIVGFYDVGRVWYKDKNGIDPSVADGRSSLWHRGVGGGLWFTPFNLTVLSIEGARASDGFLAYLRLGFLF